MKWGDSEAGRPHLHSTSAIRGLRSAITAVSCHGVMAALSQHQPGAFDKLHAFLQHAGEEKISTFMCLTWSVDSLYSGFYFHSENICSTYSTIQQLYDQCQPSISLGEKRTQRNPGALEINFYPAIHSSIHYLIYLCCRGLLVPLCCAVRITLIVAPSMAQIHSTLKLFISEDINGIFCQGKLQYLSSWSLFSFFFLAVFCFSGTTGDGSLKSAGARQ